MRLLKASEIECRVQSTKKTTKSVGCILLLYKDARVDMKILDETFGIDGWQREHQVIDGNLYCTIKIWSAMTNSWVSKQDVGTESNTEKEKGQASDSFKRAGFNVGIGRELYTSPFIWIELKEGEYYEIEDKVTKKPKYNLNANIKFQVKSIGYNSEREINQLQITDGKTVRYNLGKILEQQNQEQKEEQQMLGEKINEVTVKVIEGMIKDRKASLPNILKHYKVQALKDLTTEQAGELKVTLCKEVS